MMFVLTKISIADAATSFSLALVTWLVWLRVIVPPVIHPSIQNTLDHSQFSKNCAKGNIFLWYF